MDTKPISDMSIEEIAEQKYEIGKTWVDACAIHHRMNIGYDSGEKLRRIMAGIRMQTPVPTGKKAWTHDELRDAALATDDYKDFLNDLNVAYQAMLDTVNERDKWANMFEGRRSQMAFDRDLGKTKA